MADQPIMDFQVVLIIQMEGKLSGQADDIAIQSNPNMLCKPVLMYMPLDALSALDEEEKAHIIRLLAHHAVKRAESALRPPKTHSHEPLPIVDAPEGERN